MMKATFAKVNIGEEFTMNDMRFVKMDMVFTEGACCVPSHNAHGADSPDFIVCIPADTIVERDI